MKKTVNDFAPFVSKVLRERMFLAAGVPLCGTAAALACAWGCSAQSTGVAGLVVAPMSSSTDVAIDLDGGVADANSAYRALPPEPHQPAQMIGCQRSVQCTDPTPEPLNWPFPPPFERCKTSVPKEQRDGNEATFSVAETTKHRRDEPDTCCYIEFTGCSRRNSGSQHPVRGRPIFESALETRSSYRVATIAERADWCAFEREKNAPTNLARAEAWAQAALFEHASAAAFARFALSLMSVGAPPELIAASHRAALEEIEHAKLSFAIASYFGENDVGPNPLKTADLTIASDVGALVYETLVGGCINETLAAAIATEGARIAETEIERRVQTQIAKDETTHAELAFRTIAWAQTKDAPLVNDTIRQVLGALSTSSLIEMVDPVLDEDRCTAIVNQTMDHVIIPCLTAMLRTPERSKTRSSETHMNHSDPEQFST